MTVNGINGSNANLQSMYGMGKAMDAESRNIQKQIEHAQKQLQDLSSEDMPMEQKMEKRQEIQKQITELNQQLRQQQIDARKQAQQKSGSSMDDMLGANRQTKKGAAKSGMSGASMQAMISADVSMKQAQVQGNVATQLKGETGVLESEIKMDKSRGQDTKKKEEELADLQQNMQKATSSQIATLAEANKSMEDAAKADRDNMSEEISEEKESRKADKKHQVETSGNITDSANTEVPEPEPDDLTVESAVSESSQPLTYTPVDVRL